MRTLALLAAILLLALQAQAQPLPENAEEALEQHQPQQEDQDQDVAISSAGAESSGVWYEGIQNRHRQCTCRRLFCLLGEKKVRFCLGGVLCCR